MLDTYVAGTTHIDGIVVFSRLMDAGKLLFGKITAKEKKGSWVKIEIGIYMYE